ncbi:MAG TPA: VCBS repeat-containing protein, partial [Candidatus Methylomirabilis sp.]|nr:VCBS repeat-containing protein [Candidatus Methylomirabilis sp.]
MAGSGPGEARTTVLDLSTQPATSLRAPTSPDFNRDGTADLLWRHTSGVVAIWLMNGPTAVSVGSAGTVSTDWTIAGVGDFNGDGKTDILWRHTSGAVVVWLMDGTAVASVVTVGSVPTAWSIVGVADFNGDGRADILWR